MPNLERAWLSHEWVQPFWDEIQYMDGPGWAHVGMGWSSTQLALFGDVLTGEIQ